MLRPRTKRRRRSSFPLTSEPLEQRCLLAGDLIAHWQAQDLVDANNDGAVISEWTDAIGQLSATASGTPVLSHTAMGGRAGVRFDAADGTDSLRVVSSISPLRNAGDFSIAIVFATSSEGLQGASGDWFENTALVDASSLGFAMDWGVSINSEGQISAGVGNGFLTAPSNLYSDTMGHNDGQTHLVVFSRSGAQLSLQIDDQPAVFLDGVSTSALSNLDMIFGAQKPGGAAYTGFLAEVRVYDDSLDAAQRTALFAEFVSQYNNQTPQTADDTYTLLEDQALFFVDANNGVLSNDSDPESDPLTAMLVDAPQHGELVLNEDGSFLYNPQRDFFGTDSFTYAAIDFRPSAQATVTLNILPSHDGPLLADDTYKTTPTAPLAVAAAEGVLANDTNRDLADWSVQLDRDVTHGALTLHPDGSFQYDPQGQAGTTSFQYRIDDGVELSEAATVTLVVNTPPVAHIDNYGVDEDGLLEIETAEGLLANDDDVDGNAVTVELVEDAMQGTLDLRDDGAFRYVPSQDYHGSDQFTYRITDGIDESAPVAVMIDVRSVNDPPTAVADSYFTLPDQPLNVGLERGVLANDTDVDGTSLTAVLAAGPQNGVLELADDGRLSYTPNAGFVGQDQFSYFADDSAARSSETFVEISVSPRPVIINELMTDNARGLATRTRLDTAADFAGDTLTPDWIELKNLAGAPLNIGGMHLTDDSGNLTLWRIPDGTVIPPEDYLVIFASGLDIRDPNLDEQSLMHTNFSLDSGGEYLAIVSADGLVVDEFAPDYGRQALDVSYGLIDETYRYFDSPTPGMANTGGLIDLVADTSFSVDRGYFTEPFELQVTTSTPGATLIYTLDGDEPTLTDGTVVPPPSPTEPPVTTLTIDGTTTLRVAAMKDGYVPTNIDTQTYVFVDQVVQQSNLWDEVTTHPEWGSMLQDSILSLPTVSLVLDSRISEREVATSVEMIFPDGTKGFQIDAGVEHYGGHSLGSPKKNMRLSFKAIYGDAKLNYDLFGGDAVSQFDQILLRSGSHDTWFWTHPAGGRGNYIRNRWAFDRQLEMGHLAPHGRYVQVFINGEYVGMHHLMERPNAAFMASYLGGEREDYDALNAGTAIDGDTVAWRALQRAEVIDDYEQVQQYLDVVNYADYMLLQFYAGNDWDWNHTQNWAAARKREEGAGFIFFSWDSDVMLRTTASANVINRGGPGDLWNLRGGMKQHEEFLMLMADRAHHWFFNEGMLTNERLRQDIDELADRIRLPMIAETARWGRVGGGYSPDVWESAIRWMRDRFAPEDRSGRTETTISQLRRAGIYPDLDAPEYTVNGSRKHGGDISSDDSLEIVADAGTIYYTLDGSDPRMPGGAINPAALIFDGATIPLAGTVNIKSRALTDEWSALSETVFQVNTVPADATNLRISEVHYHPTSPTEQERAAGYTDGDDFEFIELVNISQNTLDLSNVQLRRVDVNGEDQGVDFEFATGKIQRLAPGQHVLVVEDLSAFELRYGSDLPVAGQWAGGLNNRQEQITLVAGDETIHQFTYLDTWHPSTDGQGRSLEIINPAAALSDWALATAWRASSQPGGSPGTEGPTADVPGDANRDGLFDSSDLVQVFQAGEYEDQIRQNSTWEEGDWSGDSEFDSSDLVLAFQAGNYAAGGAASLRDRVFEQW